MTYCQPAPVRMSQLQPCSEDDSNITRMHLRQAQPLTWNASTNSSPDSIAGAEAESLRNEPTPERALLPAETPFTSVDSSIRSLAVQAIEGCSAFTTERRFLELQQRRQDFAAKLEYLESLIGGFRQCWKDERIAYLAKVWKMQHVRAMEDKEPPRSSPSGGLSPLTAVQTGIIMPLSVDDEMYLQEMSERETMLGAQRENVPRHNMTPSTSKLPMWRARNSARSSRIWT